MHLPLNAFKANVSVIDEATMNALLALQDFVLIYEGVQKDAKTGTGVAEFDSSSYYHAIRFKATQTTVARVEFELVKHGNGADLILEVRDSTFNPNGASDGVLLKTMVLPKEFIPTSRAYFSIPLDLSGLILNNYYWFLIRKAGDINNHFHLHGETSQDVAYPCYYRSGTSGAWTIENSIHFKTFDGDSGNIKHGIYGTNGVTWLEYSNDILSKIYRYIPPINGYDGGVRNVLTITMSGEYLKRGVL